MALVHGKAQAAAVSSWNQYAPLSHVKAWLEIIPLVPGAITTQYFAGATQFQSRPVLQAAALAKTSAPGNAVSVEFTGVNAANTGRTAESEIATFTNPS